MAAFIGYLRQHLWIVVIVVVGSVVISGGVTAAILLRLPHDHFRRSETSGLRHLPAEQGSHKILRMLGRVLKNIVGCALIVLGVVLSLPGVPGQGILTMFAGLLLVDFPGKQKLERKVVSHPPVLAAVNKLRTKFGKPQFEL